MSAVFWSHGAMTTTKEKKTRKEERTKVDASFLKSCQMSVLMESIVWKGGKKRGGREERRETKAMRLTFLKDIGAGRSNRTEQNSVGWEDEGCKVDTHFCCCYCYCYYRMKYPTLLSSCLPCVRPSHCARCCVCSVRSDSIDFFHFISFFFCLFVRFLVAFG